MAHSVQEKVIEIIAEQAQVTPGEVTLDQSLEDLGVDSMALVEAIFAIEEAFDIQIPFNANSRDENDIDISSVAAIVGAVDALVSAKEG